MPNILTIVALHTFSVQQASSNSYPASAPTGIFSTRIFRWPKFAPGSIDTRLPRTGHDLRTFQMQTPTGLNSESGSPMPAVKVRASTILGEFGEAQSELVGRPWYSRTEKPERLTTSGLMNFTACESRSGVTTESGLSQPSNSQKATESSS